jgi:hypothetical protein
MTPGGSIVLEFLLPLFRQELNHSLFMSQVMFGRYVVYSKQPHVLPKCHKISFTMRSSVIKALNYERERAGSGCARPGQGLRPIKVCLLSLEMRQSQQHAIH